MDRLQAESEKKALLLHEQVYMLFNAIPSSVLANLFGCLVALLVYRGAVPNARLYLWVGALMLITLGRSLHYYRFKRLLPLPDDVAPWYLEFRIGSILLAAAVGSAGFLLFVYDNESYQLTLALMMVCIASFAISTMSPRAELAVLFLLIVMLPLIGSLFLTRTGAGTYGFWMMLILLAMLILSSLRISKTIARSIELTIEAGYRELDLRNFQQRLALYVKETPLAVLEWDKDLLVREWNPAAARIFGYGQDEAQGNRLNALVFASDSTPSLPELWSDLFNNTGGQQLVLENRRKDGTAILCEWFNTPLTDRDGMTIGIMSLAQDVTQRIEAEKLKQEFVSIVSHELRTPVTSIKGSLALLASGVLDDDREQSREMLNIALLNTNRLHLLINDILDVEKLEAGKLDYNFRSTDLVALVHEVLSANQAYADKFQVSIASGGLPAALNVNIDPDRIFQVLTNLLSNAVKFSVPQGVVTVGLAVSGGRVRVSVNNRGEVIPEADRERMFSRFFQRDSSTTRSREGTGLGLYICQKILEAHSSRLDYTSNATDGTTFFFALRA